MDLLAKTKGLCARYNIKPQYSKGQNFLICDWALQKIINTSDLCKNDVVLEIGPGLGILTKELAANAKKVVAVELDNKLCAIVQKELHNFKNIEYINDNILNISPAHLEKIIGESGRYKIVANIPYNITGAFLKKFLSMPTRPQMMTLMLQKEVAERICEKPGNMSVLAVSSQFYAKKAEIIKVVPKDCFFPKPDVDSAIFKLSVKESFLHGSGETDEKNFFQLVKIGFSARRKMLKNNLLNGLHGMGLEVAAEDIGQILDNCGLDRMIRAQELSVEDWKKLSGEVQNFHKSTNQQIHYKFK